MPEKPHGVFCLEGEWDDSIASPRLSIEPALRLLETIEPIRIIHRDVATTTELEHYLDRWLTIHPRERFDLVYLGFHGSALTLHLGRDDIGLDQLAQMIDGRCRNKVIYFGACSVLKADDKRLREFCRRSGAKAVAGYTRNVDWVETAAFELLLVSTLAKATNMKPAYGRLCKQYPEFTRRLGFRMATPAWSSERSIAVSADA